MPGTKTGAIRLSSSHGVSNGEGVFPGAAIKFLRTGQSSGNFVGSNGMTPIPNYNFFAVSLKNHMPLNLPYLKLKLVEMKSKQANLCTQKLGLSDLAR